MLQKTSESGLAFLSEALKAHGALLLCASLYVFNCYYYLLNQIVYFDDATSLRLTYKVDFVGLHGLTDDIHTIGYNLLLYIWLALFDGGLVAGKVMSMGLGGFVIYFTYIFAKKHFPESYAALPCLLLSTSPAFFHFVHQVRAYPLLILITTISFYSFSGFIKRSTRDTSLFGATTPLLPLVHFAGVFVWVAQLVSIVLTRDLSSLLRISRVFAISLLAMIPVLAALTARYDLKTEIPQTYYWVQDSDIHSLWNWLPEISGDGVITALSVGLFVVAIISNRSKTTLLMLLLWILVPRLCFYLYGELHTPLPFRRGTASMIIPAALLMGLGLSEFFKQGKLLKIVGVCLVAFLLFDSERKTLNTYNWGKMNFSEASPHIKSARKVLFYPKSFARNMALLRAPKCLKANSLLDCLEEYNATLLRDKGILMETLRDENIDALLVWDIEESWTRANFNPTGYNLVYNKYIHIWERD